MIKNYFKIAWRNVWKHKFYTGINILGLALSIGCSVILFQFINYHLSFDTYHHDARQLYKSVTELHLDDGSVDYEQGSSLALASAVKTTIPQVNDVAAILRIHDITVTIPQTDGNASKLFSEHEDAAIADGHFFNLFDYDWEQGNKATALNEPKAIVLSHSMAQKYFGSQDIIGKTLMVDNKNTFKVTGVIKDHPANTDIKADIFLSLATLKDIYPDVARSMQNDWGFINSTTAVYVSLPNNYPASNLEAAVKKMRKADLGDAVTAYRFKFQPLSDVHFDGRFSGVIQKSLLTTLGVVGLLLMVIACVNFINMATAQSFKRAKEIGTRKVLGSSPSAIFLQFIAETAYIVLFAAILAITWISLFLPVLNRWLQTTLTFNFTHDYRLLLFFMSTLAIIILAAGAYPALILSRFRPVNALKNQVTGQSQTANSTRKGLIVFQNVIAQVFIISAILITMQVNFLKTADMGFNKKAVLMLPVPDYAKSKTDQLRNQLLSFPGILSVSFCYRAPASTVNNGGSVKLDGRQWENFSGREALGDADYVKTFGLQLIAGRNLAESDTAREYLVNELLVQKLRLKNAQDAIGHRFTAGDIGNNAGTIVGVVRDFHPGSFYQAIQPEYITTFRKGYQFMGVKIGAHDVATTIEHIKKEWQSVYPENVFEYHFLDQQIADFYQKEDLLNRLIRSSAIIAISISCLGLLGLISLLTIQRTKEIGIRKVLGASVMNIITLLSTDFLKLVLIAAIIGAPVAWLVMNNYLQNFAYRIDMQWWVFVSVALMAVLIAFGTVCYQSIKAAIANPVDSLRDE